MATGLTIIGAGLAFCLISIAMAFNTSAGGTRSDHSDGSEAVGKIGLLVIAVGVVWSVVEVCRWLI